MNQPDDLKKQFHIKDLNILFQINEQLFHLLQVLLKAIENPKLAPNIKAFRLLAGRKINKIIEIPLKK